MKEKARGASSAPLPLLGTINTVTIVFLLGIFAWAAAACFCSWLAPAALRQDFQAQLLPQLSFQLGHHVFVVFQELLDVFAALADALAFVAEPGAGLLHDVLGPRPDRAGRLRGRCLRHT